MTSHLPLPAKLRILAWLFVRITVLSLGTISLLAATDYYVDQSHPSASDSNAGTNVSSPFASIQKAADTASAGDTVWIRAGRYSESLTFANSGNASNRITYRAYENGGVPEDVVITTLREVQPGQDGNGHWQNHGGGIYKIQLTNNFAVDSFREMQVFYNEEPMSVAKWPNSVGPITLSRDEMAGADGGATLQGSSGGNDYTALLFDPDQTFATGAWNNGHFFGVLGWGWRSWFGDVVYSESGMVQISYPLGYDNQQWNIVQEHDFYFLTGRLVGLDIEREFFYDINGYDGPARTLYLRAPGSANPAGGKLEVRTATNVVDFGHHRYITLLNLKLVAGNVNCDSSSQGLRLDHVDMNYCGFDLAGHEVAAINMQGSDHEILNSSVLNTNSKSFQVTKPGTATNVTIRNSVFGNSTLSGVDTTRGTNFLVEDNTMFGVGDIALGVDALNSTYTRNHAYLNGRVITDVATINTWGIGDAQGSVISYNWAHDNDAIFNSDLHWNGGAGIRLDSGASVNGVSNVTIHHNVVWNTTQRANIIVWGLANYMDNYGNSQINIYNNTVESEIQVIDNDPASGFSDVGTRIINNLAGHGYNNSGSSGGVTLSALHNNYFAMTEWPNNHHGDNGYVSIPTHHFMIEPTAGAVDNGTSIAGITTNVVDGSPDIGAYELGVTPFIPGAKLRDEDTAALAATARRGMEGNLYMVVGGLPMGRHPSEDFRLRVGGTTYQEPKLNWDFDTHSPELWFPINEVSGPVLVEFSLTGSGYQTLDNAVSIPAGGGGGAVSVIDFSDTVIDAATGGTITVTGSGFNSVGSNFNAIDFPSYLPDDVSTLPVLLLIDTQALISAGTINSNGSGLVFQGGDGTVLDYWIEKGLNTTETSVWVRYPDDIKHRRQFSQLDHSRLYLSFNKSTNHSISRAQMLYFEGDPKLELWMEADHLDATHNDGDSVASWEDQTAFNFDAFQTSPSARPTYAENEFNGLPGISFDGNTQYLQIADGLTAYDQTIISLYRNPDPLGGSSGNFQRIFSARDGSFNNDNDYVQPHFTLFAPLDSGNQLIPHSDPEYVFHRPSPGAGIGTDRFRVGVGWSGYAADNLNGFFRGTIGFLFFYAGKPDAATTNALESYLFHKYALDTAGRMPYTPSGTPTTLSATVDGQPATINILDDNTLEIVLDSHPDAGSGGGGGGGSSMVWYEDFTDATNWADAGDFPSVTAAGQNLSYSNLPASGGNATQSYASMARTVGHDLDDGPLYISYLQRIDDHDHTNWGAQIITINTDDPSTEIGVGATTQAAPPTYSSPDDRLAFTISNRKDTTFTEAAYGADMTLSETYLQLVKVEKVGSEMRVSLWSYTGGTVPASEPSGGLSYNFALGDGMIDNIGVNTHSIQDDVTSNPSGSLDEIRVATTFEGVFGGSSGGGGSTFPLSVNVVINGGSGAVGSSPAYYYEEAYDGWVIGNYLDSGLPGDPLSVSLDALDDYDGDGMKNLMEYALEGDPFSAGSIPAPTVERSGSTIRLSFKRSRADLNYVIEQVDQLGNAWSPISTNPGSVGATVNVNATQAVPVFLRLCVEQN